MHPAAIHLVGIAGKMQEKNCFRNVQTHDVDLNVRPKRVGGVNLPKQLCIYFFLNINRYKQLLKNGFIVTKHILLSLKK